MNVTCPQKRYMQADYKYSGVLQALIGMAVSVEHKLTGDTLSMVLYVCSETDGMDERAEEFLQNISDCYAAWNETLEGIGVDAEAMSKLAEPMRHPVVVQILSMELPKSDLAAVQKIRDGHEDFLQKLQNV